MISMPSFAPSASKSHDKGAKREQNPPYSHYNGLSTSVRAEGSKIMKFLYKHAIATILLALSLTAPVMAGPFEDGDGAIRKSW